MLTEISPRSWYDLKEEECLSILESGIHGLTEDEAEARLRRFGQNVLPRKKSPGFFSIFINQFRSSLIYVLFAAGLMLFLIGETSDALIVGFVLVFNATLGAIQEGRAQNTLRALERYVQTKATVLRDGEEFTILDREVVPGDILVLEEGDKIAADIRLISAQTLKVDESALTGESAPVHKTTELIQRDRLSIGEQINLAFKGTHVVLGHGRGVVVATGLGTVIGKISKEIASIEREIPLHADIRRLSQMIVMTVLGICSLLFVIGILTGKTLIEMFGTVVSLAVSIIPEGLPIVMTLVLATGVWRMSKRQALVKRLQAVEALGQASVIAVDKTGTITKNEMTVQQVWVEERLFRIGGAGYEPRGTVQYDSKVVDPLNHPELVLMGKIAALATNSRLSKNEDDQRWYVSGDPTDGALLVLAEKFGIHKDELEAETPRTGEVPFDYKNKYHATFHATDHDVPLVVVGAPEAILKLSKRVWRGGKSFPLTDGQKNQLEQAFTEMASQGLRTVACAIHREPASLSESQKIGDLTFVGFFGIKDPLRPEVFEALALAQRADVRVVMITGDHIATARAIAQEAGIFHEGDTIISGSELERMSDETLAQSIASVSVFARVTPEHKLRIVNAYRRGGQVVAMTGDGVNDAPSLVAADLGVAMGVVGTEVAKEAADIVLLDDNFGSIVLAIEEGRNIYRTIKKVILYLFSTSFGEVMTITGAILLSYPLPLLPAQIIWLNLITDSFLDVALGMEPKDPDLLKTKMARSKKQLVDGLMAGRIALMGLVMMIGTLYLFERYLDFGMIKAWSIALTTLAVFQWFNAWNCRSDRESIFSRKVTLNPFLILATMIVIGLQLLAIYHPFLQGILRTGPLAIMDWVVIVAVASSVIVVEELRKFIVRSRFKRG